MGIIYWDLISYVFQQRIYIRNIDVILTKFEHYLRQGYCHNTSKFQEDISPFRMKLKARSFNWKQLYARRHAYCGRQIHYTNAGVRTAAFCPQYALIHTPTWVSQIIVHSTKIKKNYMATNFYFSNETISV